MKLLLVRHGRVDESHAWRPNDPPLSDEGRVQAQNVAEHLADEGITSVVSSPLLRACQTAEPLSRLLGKPATVVDGWAEADRGLSPYRSPEALRALGSQQWQRFLEDPTGYFGIDEAAFRAGVIEALLQETRGAAPGLRVAVFTHGLPINAVLSHVLGLQSIVPFAPAYASITRLRVGRSGAVTVESVNERGHLRGGAVGG